MIPKKTTKMIVKDGSGNLVQLLPEIETASAIDASSDVPVSNAALASALEDIEDSLPASALLDVMDEEPTALNTTELDDEALIVWMQPESWSITINTELAGAGEKKGQIPFNLYAMHDLLEINASIKVDWGDGNKLTYSTSTESENKCVTYEYANPGIYTITIYSNLFESLYIWSSQLNNDPDDPSVYRATLTSINSPLPRLAGEYSFIGSGDFASFGTTTFEYCFDDCSSLQSIPSGMFDNNTQIMIFGGCFSGCRSLQSIPSGLFDKNTAATDFAGCFHLCTSLSAIPAGLFDHNTLVTSFFNCFNRCTSLTSIPEGLFDHNTAVTMFFNCFNGCSSLQSIPSELFANNTAVTDFRYCFDSCSSLNDFILHIGSSLVSNCTSFVTKKTGTTRTIYVPSGSTTQTTFNSKASTLGLTIIGE